MSMDYHLSRILFGQAANFTDCKNSVWTSRTSQILNFQKDKTLDQVNPVTNFYLFLRMLSHLMIYHDIVRSGDCYKICLGGSLSRNKGCKSFFLIGDNNQWLLCYHDGKACKNENKTILISLFFGKWHHMRGLHPDVVSWYVYYIARCPDSVHWNCSNYFTSFLLALKFSIFFCLPNFPSGLFDYQDSNAFWKCIDWFSFSRIRNTFYVDLESN